MPRESFQNVPGRITFRSLARRRRRILEDRQASPCQRQPKYRRNYNRTVRRQLRRCFQIVSLIVGLRSSLNVTLPAAFRHL